MQTDNELPYPPPSADAVACGNCRFFERERPDEGEPQQGSCRKLPPTIRNGCGKSFPTVHETYWCGAFERKPVKSPMLKRRNPISHMSDEERDRFNRGSEIAEVELARLPTKLRSILTDHGIFSRQDLKQAREDDLVELKGVGNTYLAKIRSLTNDSQGGQE